MMRGQQGLKALKAITQVLRPPVRLSGHALASTRRTGRAHRLLPAPGRTGLRPTTATMTTVVPPPKGAAAPQASTEWKVAVKVVTGSPIIDLPLKFACVDEQSGELTELNITDFSAVTWKRPGNKDGQIFTGKLQLDSSINPGALELHYTGPAPPADKPKSERVWVSEVILSADGRPETSISAHGWVNKLNSPRVFFKGTGLLPLQTPDGLQGRRQRELDIIKGVNKELPPVNTERKFSDRVEEYDVYNDLGRLPADPKQQTFDPRPVLGDMVDGYKYPRRLRTGRPLAPDGKRETNAPGDIWVPQDEDFDETKSDNFSNDARDYLVLPLVAQTLKTATTALHKVNRTQGLVAGLMAVYNFFIHIIRVVKGKEPLFRGGKGTFQGGQWNSFADVMAIYHKKHSANAASENIAAQAKVGEEDEDMREVMRGLPEEKRNMILRVKGVKVADWEAPEKRIDSSVWDSLRRKVNAVLQWEVPLVYAGRHCLPLDSDGVNPPARPTAWQTDEEYGRQFLAGQNPIVITAPSALPQGCTITGEHVDGLLEGGDTLQHLLSKAGSEPKLFLVDYMEPYRSYAARIEAQDGPQSAGGRKQHAGRLLLYKKETTGHLLPVAIELWHEDGSPDGKTAVYTPANSHEKVWMVAKAIFASLDSGIHQLVSHWLRTHACQEPYILATDRCLSVMHPVYKLLTPHFIFTLRMNANARSTLINMTGILEATFTPGKYTMQLSAKAYEGWMFKEQGLPHDLIARRVAKEGHNGELKVLLDDYPYAEDGLLIWNALRKWNDGYLNLYYKEDKDVADDKELQAWWAEIRTQGHADADPAGWPENCKDGIRTVADLSDTTTTMAWMGSAHHAAVNFAQYDFSGLTLNRSPLIRAAIPEEGTPAYKELTSSDPAVHEKAFLTYIANPFPATRIVALMTVLSQHAPNEHYLSDEDQGFVYDGEALKLHQAFVADMAAAEATIAQRNSACTASVARSLAEGGLPYNYLVPSSPALTQEQRDSLEPNITGRGIPYSISI